MDELDRSKISELLPGHVSRHGLERVCADIERFGPDFLRGLLQAERAGANGQHIANQERPLRPEPPQIPQKPRIHIWERLGFAAIENHHTGGYRAWELARHVCGAGRSGNRWDGVITRKALRDAFKLVNVNQRTARRWMAEALELKLFYYDRENKRYFVAGLAPAAEILGAKIIGLPADVERDPFFHVGWGAYLWAGYEATKKGKVCSQAIKARETGVSRRRQCNYINGRTKRLPDGRKIRTRPPLTTKRTNYLQTDLSFKDLQRLVDTKAGKVVRNRRSMTVRLSTGEFLFWGARQGKVYRRLPNIVLPQTAEHGGQKMTARKAQAKLNSSQSGMTGKSVYQKLFYENSERLTDRLKDITREGVGPDQLFSLRYSGRKSNVWKPVYVAGVLL